VGKRRKGPPGWVQGLIVWFVVSTLSTMGVMYLRATDRISDGVFGPLSGILCARGERLVTSYEWTDQAPLRDFGDSLERQRGPIATVRAAECVDPSQGRRPAPGFHMTVWVATATGVAVPFLLAWTLRRRTAR